MSVNSIGSGRIGPIQQQQITSIPQQEVQKTQQRRLELNTSETFERNSAGSRDLSQIQSGVVSSGPQVGFDALCAGMTPQQAADVKNASLALGTAIMEAGPLASTSSAVQAASISAQEILKGAEQQNNMNTQFGQMALYGAEQWLADFAYRVQQGNEYGRNTRTQLTELRGMIADWPEGKTQQFSWTEVSFDKDGKATATQHTANLTKDEAEKLMGKLESQLTDCSGMNQLLQVDLQNKNQEYQQISQTISAILKDIHDTSKAVINNLR